MVMITNKNGYRLKCDTPNGAAAINHLHSDSTLVNLSTVKYPNAFACASGTGRVRGELGRPNVTFTCFGDCSLSQSQAFLNSDYNNKRNFKTSRMGSRTPGVTSKHVCASFLIATDSTRTPTKLNLTHFFKSYSVTKFTNWLYLSVLKA